MAEGRIENLVDLRDRTTEEQREIAKKGGIASGEARREKKLLRELLEEALAENTATGNKAVDITRALIEQAQKGNVKAYETIRDTVGEKPTDKLDTNMNGKLEVVMCKDLKELSK